MCFPLLVLGTFFCVLTLDRGYKDASDPDPALKELTV